MNFPRKTFVVAAAIFLLVTVCPPWLYTTHRPVNGGVQISQRPAGFYPIFDPPAPERREPGFGIALDFPLLFLEWLAVAVATLLVLMVKIGRRGLVVGAASLLVFFLFTILIREKLQRPNPFDEAEAMLARDKKVSPHTAMSTP